MVKEPLKKDFLEQHEDYAFYLVYSETEGKAVLQEETGAIYGSVAMREDDQHTYSECDDPNYNPANQT